MDRTIEKQAIRQQRTWKMKLRFTDSDLKKSSMMFIITNIILCSATFGQDVYNPLFHFSFDGHAKDSLGKTVLEAQESFLWRRPVVEPQDLEFSGNALYVNRGGGKQSYIFRTPSLDYDKFTVVLRVKPECSPKDRINLVTGGYWLRWFTMFRNDLGELCVALNNERIEQVRGRVTRICPHAAPRQGKMREKGRSCEKSARKARKGKGYEIFWQAIGNGQLWIALLDIY